MSLPGNTYFFSNLVFILDSLLHHFLFISLSLCVFLSLFVSKHRQYAAEWRIFGKNHTNVRLNLNFFIESLTLYFYMCLSKHRQYNAEWTRMAYFRKNHTNVRFYLNFLLYIIENFTQLHYRSKYLKRKVDSC